jgi:hypothetical protein
MELIKEGELSEYYGINETRVKDWLNALPFLKKIEMCAIFPTRFWIRALPIAEVIDGAVFESTYGNPVRWDEVARGYGSVILASVMMRKKSKEFASLCEDWANHRSKTVSGETVIYASSILADPVLAASFYYQVSLHPDETGFADLLLVDTVDTFISNFIMGVYYLTEENKVDITPFWEAIEQDVAKVDAGDFDWQNEPVWGNSIPDWMPHIREKAINNARIRVEGENDLALWNFFWVFQERMMQGQPQDWALLEKVASVSFEDWNKGIPHIADIIRNIEKEHQGSIAYGDGVLKA